MMPEKRKILIISDNPLPDYCECLQHHQTQHLRVFPSDISGYDLVAVDLLKMPRSIPDTPALIALSDSINTENSETVKKLAIPFFINYDILFSNFSRLYEIGSNPEKTDQIAVFEKDPAKRRIINTISSLFSYNCIFPDTFEELLNFNDDSVSFIFADISSSDFSSEQYIKKALFSRLKFIPFIPYYKNNSISIEDVLCGLNKVAKVVMSFDELLSFMAHNFSACDLSAKSEELSSVLGSGIKPGTIKSSYFSNSNILFNHSKNIFTNEFLLSEKIESLSLSLLKRELVKWLIIE